MGGEARPIQPDFDMNMAEEPDDIVDHTLAGLTCPDATTTKTTHWTKVRNVVGHIDIFVVFYIKPGSNSGIVRLEAITCAFDDGEIEDDWNTHGGQSKSVSQDGTYNKVYFHKVASHTTENINGRIFCAKVKRLGADALDTFTDSIFVMGCFYRIIT